MKRILCLGLLVQGMSLAAGPVLPVPMATVTPVIDGTLGAAEWSGAARAEMRTIDQGVVPGFGATSVHVLWDRQNLYLAFEATDDNIVATMTKRDDELYEQDAVEFFINPQGPGGRYFEFEWSPKNVVFDLLLNPTEQDQVSGAAWNVSGMLHAVQVRGSVAAGGKDTSYLVEVAIPWSSLSNEGLVPVSGLKIPVNFYRAQSPVVGANGGTTEWSAWSPTGAVQAHALDMFGALELTGGAAGLEPAGRGGLASVPSWDAQGRPSGQVQSPGAASLLKPSLNGLVVTKE